MTRLWASLPIAGMLVLALLGGLAIGCDDELQQACEPGLDDRCAPGETCAIDQAGTPLCIVPGAAEEGALCRLAEEAASLEPAVHCAEKLGCARVSGVSRCMRFCAAERPCRSGEPAPVMVGDGQQRLRQAARCVGVLPDRPEIGLCVLPCRPDRVEGCLQPGVCAAFPEDCPDGAVCGIDPQAPVPVCIPAGAGVVGDRCDGESGCQSGLLCARIDGESRCQLATNLRDRCPDGHHKVPLAGVDDPLVSTGEALEAVCVPFTPGG